MIGEGGCAGSLCTPHPLNVPMMGPSVPGSELGMLSRLLFGGGTAPVKVMVHGWNLGTIPYPTSLSHNPLKQYPL